MAGPAPASALPPGWCLEVHDSLPSTSDHLLVRAEAGAPDGLGVLAHRQTAGRGTGGRHWVSPPGNLHFSLLTRPPIPMALAGLEALTAAVALAEVLAGHLPADAPLTLKWPNDVLLGGAKLAGILCDSRALPDGRLDWLIGGFGVNLAVAPALPDRPTASLAGSGPAPAPEEVAVRLMWRLFDWRRRCAAEGHGAARAAWLARAHPLGTRLSLRQGARDVAGDFAGLAEDGRLLLATATGIQAFAAGEVSATSGGT